MVEVELDKNFPDRILAEDEQGNVSLVDVEYAWLPSKCSYCGVLGHKESRCLKDSPQVPPVTNTPSTILVTQVPSIDKALVTQKDSPVDDLVVSVTTEATTPIVKDTGLSSSISLSSPEEEAVIVSSDALVLSSSTEEANVITSSSVTLAAPALSISSPLEAPPCFISSTPSPSGPLTVPSELGCSSDSLEFGAVAEYETRGGRSVKPSVKLKDMEWSTVGKGKHGRGDRGGRRGRPSSNPP